MKHAEYFYTPPENIKNDIVEISGSEFTHLTVVLRKRKASLIHVVDGVGGTYTVELIEIDKKRAFGKIQKKTRFQNEPTFHLTLAQAIPKGSRFEIVIEKGTEIGVSRFIPLLSERTIVEAGTTKLNRWKKIAIAAMKQSMRSVLPEITIPKKLEQLIHQERICHYQFIAHPDGMEQCLTEIILEGKNDAEKIAGLKNGIVLVGPEGGFTASELELATDSNYKSFSLGNRRLRSETAGIVSAAIIFELIENWK